MRWVKILERVLAVIPVVLGVAIIVFIFMRLTPGDPIDLLMGQDGQVSEREVQLLQEQWNLDKPLHIQLSYFLQGIAKGDFGNSITRNRPVTSIILEVLPATIELALASTIIALLISLPIGVISAVKQNSLLDRLSMGGAFLGISMPVFWLGIVLMIIFSLHLGWVPTYGRIGHDVALQKVTGFYVIDSILTGNMPALVSSLKHLFLPSITLGAQLAAIVARVMRSSMLDVLRNDYVVMARAKGLKESRVVVKHAMRNAMIPTITVIGLEMGSFLGGNMIVETVFGWPGMGRLVVNAIFVRDYPLVEGAVMLYAFTFVFVNLIVDVLYTYINPKITF